MYLDALHRISSQTMDSSLVFKRRVFQKQPKIINKTIKSYDTNTIKYLEPVCLQQAHDFLT